MKQLYDFILEQQAPSEDDILFRAGVNWLNGIQAERARNYIKKYNINKNNNKPGVLRLMRDLSDDLIDPKDELIPRDKWSDMSTLVGETEMQLMHPDYYKAAQRILKKHKAKHNCLCIFQCTSKKPYHSASHMKALSTCFAETCDFAALSNPGVVPLEYDSCYPFRYDEWSIPNEEKLHDLIDMTTKYRIVNMCRFLRYKREMGYEHVIAYVPNKLKQWIFDECVKKDIEGTKDQIHIVFTDAIRARLKKKYPSLGGMVMSRAMGFGTSYQAFEKLLKQYSDDPDAVQDEWDEYKSKHKLTTESLKDPEYKILKSISYDEIMTKFKEYVKPNMENSKVDKGKNNLYYKSYYWTALDILLIGLDGNLIEDIDGAYWDLVKHIKKDKDFKMFSDFLFAYKPLLKKDDVSLQNCQDEADSIDLTNKPENWNVKSSLFK